MVHKKKAPLFVGAAATVGPKTLTVGAISDRTASTNKSWCSYKLFFMYSVYPLEDVSAQRGNRGTAAFTLSHKRCTTSGGARYNQMGAREEREFHNSLVIQRVNFSRGGQQGSDELMEGENTDEV